MKNRIPTSSSLALPSPLSGLLALALCVAPLALPAGADAAVLYDNGVGGAAGLSNAVGSDPSIPQFVADDFIPTATGTVLSVQWTGGYGTTGTPLATDSFTIVFYADSGGGVPGAAIGTFPVGNAVGRVDSTVNLLGLDVYNYTATVNQPVTMGTTHWLSIVNDTTADTDDNWFWGRDLGGTAALSLDQTTWAPLADRSLDFVLHDTVVPEPGTAVLLVLGGGLALLTRSRRRTSPGAAS